ncbi:WD40/YVTN/BNR-like repeat-containing protein [Pedobacter punctiformis]|uniref:YCF48-related protein n=1 Tax=Pedobacter punctiformis TaxID=3004097 RepID=A0ABT4L8T9_9SPHI|nr:YCF48-related protein [Pedobacter sp. HCMS5-2]MCZ4244271.1 YCF48-related protein [Pedobacter sp. HCMS5-2]
MKKILWCLFMAPFFCAGQTYNLKPLNENTKTSIRGLSVVSNQVTWVSGSGGTIGKTTDGGTTWQWIKPKGYEKLDFRDIEAFDDQQAIVVNAGSPAYILKTIDGGQSWTETYKNMDTAIFLDGLGFWDKNKAIIFGDPIKNQMQLLKTTDAGKSWTAISANLKQVLAEGEAGFAASGTTIKTLPGGKVWVATGGKVSNIYFSGDYGANWQVFKCPIWQGENSTGPFSIDFYDAKNGVAVGGNYVKDKENSNNIVLTADGGKTWTKPVTPVFGYRSGVAYLNAKTLVATGTSGTDISTDGGQNWKHISDVSFNSVQKAKKGNAVILAGNKGFVYQLELKAN